MKNILIHLGFLFCSLFTNFVFPLLLTHILIYNFSYLLYTSVLQTLPCFTYLFCIFTLQFQSFIKCHTKQLVIMNFYLVQSLVFLINYYAALFPSHLLNPFRHFSLGFPLSFSPFTTRFSDLLVTFSRNFDCLFFMISTIFPCSANPFFFSFSQGYRLHLSLERYPCYFLFNFNLLHSCPSFITNSQQY